MGRERNRMALLERFGLLVSISQRNPFRAAHSISSRRREKNGAAPSEAPAPEPVWQEGAGFLLLAAASSIFSARLAHRTSANRERLLFPLLLPLRY